ncbi:Ig-like domain-containing protein [Haloarcula onubensis]|uniref:Ig-like domain-containing protein n=1 Tax=Haloarcula onubensis TaxID=2950539 RepID=A0ABU2FT70_9EURY|nr:Ig-like domain-containing protein [Halomicroarcula sp. S3CR25-11]MDS0283964.1 Ig-like domain-containing protein [Halomicroarcula sp. S3CR25-11]
MKWLRQFLIHSVGNFAKKRLVVGGITLLLVSSAVIGAAAGDLLIPSPEPGVERDYDDTFRVLASNDPDPGRGSSVVQVYEYGENGTIREVNRTVGTQPVQLWDSNIQSRDALLIANESDMYQSGLSGFVQVPYRDQWTPLRDWWGGEFRILPIYTADPSRATSNDGQYTVEVRHPNGWWNPVYNADVERVDGELTVTDTDEALVLSSYYSTVIDRKIQIIESLLQHSEMAPSDSAARSTSVVPTQNGVEVFPTTDGADVDLQWQSGSHALVRDAYVGNIDVIPGVWHDGRYVTQSQQLTTYIPWDYRVEAPADYSESGSCTVTRRTEEGNTTVTSNGTASLTRWANYRIIDSNASVVNVTAGNISLDRTQPGMWTTINYTTSRPRHLPPGTYDLTATLRTEVEMETHYGVSSSECSEWDTRRTVNRVVELQYSVPIETVNSDDLSIDVQVYDRPGRDIVAVNWSGEQGLAAGAAAWEDIEIQIGEKTMYVTAPWRFYSVARNTHIEERTRSGTTQVDASHSYDGAYPAMLRYRMSPASVGVLAEQSADQRIWWETTYAAQNRSVPAASLPSTIVAPENTEPTYLYDQYAGILKSMDRTMGETVSAQAGDVWGLPVDTSVNVVRYQASELTITMNHSARTAEVFLSDSAGNPIPNRLVSLDGASVQNVTTDANGRATAAISGTLVRAHFAGDNWRESRSSYYMEARSYGVSPASFVAGSTDLFGYLDAAISNTVVFVEWLVLGIFALFWMRFMREKSV